LGKLGFNPPELLYLTLVAHAWRDCGSVRGFGPTSKTIYLSVFWKFNTTLFVRSEFFVVRVTRVLKVKAKAAAGSTRKLLAASPGSRPTLQNIGRREGGREAVDYLE
jgi:hypothetical protein